MGHSIPIKKILFPTDFSEMADAALARAIDLAEQNQAALLITHVIPPAPVVASHEAMSTIGLPELADRIEQWTEENLDDWLAQRIPDSIRKEKRVLHGRPADSIAEAALAEDVDLIVMATHGHGGIKKFFFGSVAERVVRQAECPVLVVPVTSDS